MLSYSQLQWLITSGAAGRLVLAAALGCAIGVDRELHHRPSGVRNNVLICFGAAMFAFLSPIIAGEASGNRAQIASNIVQGIGFLGAGLILHNRDRVSGQTSAATVWSVALIGMACGAGLYFPAVFATILVLVLLEVVRQIEFRGNLKIHSVTCEVRGTDSTEMSLALLRVMDQQKRQLREIRNQPIGAIMRLSFDVSGTRRGHRRLQAAVASAPGIEQMLAFCDPEDE